jgi:hypothetical protein
MEAKAFYRPTLGLNAALAEIENKKGTLHDVDVADVCLRLLCEKDFQLEGASFRTVILNVIQN